MVVSEDPEGAEEEESLRRRGAAVGSPPESRSPRPITPGAASALTPSAASPGAVDGDDDPAFFRDQV